MIKKGLELDMIKKGSHGKQDCSHAWNALQCTVKEIFKVVNTEEKQIQKNSTKLKQ